ncbi:MAG: hypothetical protein Q7U44_05240 [Desulfuromonadales bacterium]|nr:hypothetical protein [Desulfuromonadales bacterium]
MVVQALQSITVSAAVAKIVNKDVPYADRLAAARGETSLSGRDLLTALYFLYCGGDRDIRSAGVRTLRQLPPESLAEVAALPDLAPPILHFLAQVRGSEPLLFQAIIDHPACPQETLIFLLEHAERRLFSQVFDRETLWRSFPEAVSALLRNPQLTEEERAALVNPVEPDPLDDEEDGEELAVIEDPPPPDEENYSKYQLAIDMGVSEKIKMALTGDKEWRSIFLKDSNKLVNTAVLKNPRVTDGEVLAVVKSKTSSEELIRIVLMNKDWMKLSAVRSALVSHPKTPVASALRFMDSLTIKELKDLSKSKSVSQVVVAAARRVLAEKAKKK